MGTATDDTGRPTPLMVSVSLTGQAVAGGAEVNLSSAAPEPCDARPPTIRSVPRLESPTRLVLQTDEAGRFCIRLLLPAERYVAHLATEPSDLVEAAKLDVPIDLALRPAALRFAPEPTTLSMDDETVVIDLVAETDIDGSASPIPELTVHLANESGEDLADTTTDASGRARFAVSGARMGPAGPGELRAVSDATTSIGAVSHSAPVERRTRVRLAVPGAQGGVLPAGRAGDGLVVRATALPQCAVHGCTGNPTGIVEARIGGAVVGAGTLVHGVADVVFTVASPGSGSAAVKLRYVPDAPWFLAANEVDLLQPMKPAGAWGALLSAIGGVVVLAWFALARVPRTLAAREAVMAEQRARGPADIQVLDQAPPHGGWKGRILDGHDASAIAAAIVTIERPGFEGSTLVATTTSDEAGAFVLPAVDMQPNDRLAVQSTLHVSLRRPMPPSGTLEVTLVLRRRALLDRLVAWARRRGGRFDQRPEPTPAHVRGAAVSEPRVAVWASAVERAAFGPDPVDDRAEGDVDRLAPPDAERPPQT